MKNKLQAFFSSTDHCISSLIKGIFCSLDFLSLNFHLMTSFYMFITQTIKSSSLCTRSPVFVCYQLSFGKLKGALIAVHDEIIIIFFLLSFSFLLMSDS